MAKRIDPSQLPVNAGTLYPPPFDEPCISRERRRLGDAAGLTQFGVNLLRLPSGAWSSQRHWHTHEDEFVYVLSGEVVLVTDEGEEVLKAGGAAGFRGGDQNGHHLQNRSNADALVLEIGSRIEADGAFYPGLDLIAAPDGAPALYTHLDGTPYENLARKSVKR
ncbi:MAG: cupin domain-containing protein [Rhizobiaceae bacterium]